MESDVPSRPSGRNSGRRAGGVDDPEPRGISSPQRRMGQNGGRPAIGGLAAWRILVSLPGKRDRNDGRSCDMAAGRVGERGRAQQAEHGCRPEASKRTESPGSDRARHDGIAPIGHSRHSGEGIISIVLAVNRSCQCTSVERPRPGWWRHMREVGAEMAKRSRDERCGESGELAVCLGW